LLIPIATDRPCRRFPVVTTALIAINTLVFLLEVMSDGPGVLNWAFTPGHPRLITILTSSFMHGGLLHLVFNMLFLWVFGSVVEDALGPLVYALFYLGGAIAAELLDWAVIVTMAPQQAGIPSLGASGAVAAVLAMFMVRFYRNNVRIFYLIIFYFLRWGTFEIGSLWAVGIWFGWEVISGFLNLGAGDGVAHWAHIGGFLFGVGMGFAMRSPQDAARASLAVMAPRAAIEKLLPIVQAEPENDEARAQLARAYEVAGETAAADQQWLMLLRQRLRQRRKAEVVELLRQTARPGLLAAADPRTLYDVACCFEESFQYAEAVQLLQRIWREQPMAPEAELALLRQATLMKERLHDPTAHRLFDQFLQQYPHSQYRAFALAKRGAGS
jgi:membrane associated rhomboid family serine protease